MIGPAAHSLTLLLGVIVVLASCASERERKTEAAPDGALGAFGTVAPKGTSGITVRFVGRFDDADPAGPRFAWPGSAIETRVSGGSLDVRLRDSGTNEFQVVLDGAPLGVIATSPGRERYTLGGLGDGEHEVTLYKRTEARLGEVQFLGFIPGPGAHLLPVPPPPSRHIEFIGDSITAGYGNEGPNPMCPFTPSTENEYMAFGALTARALGADHVTIAWSGKTVEQMAEIWDRTLPDHVDSRWSFRDWIPDAVVVNLGTNDFSFRDPGKSFVASYVGFLDRVRARYPTAFLFCTLGPMLADTYPPGAWNLSHARAYIAAAVEAERSKGETRIAFVEFPVQEPMTAGCHFHPNLTTHRTMADQLTVAIRSKLGW